MTRPGKDHDKPKNSLRNPPKSLPENPAKKSGGRDQRLAAALRENLRRRKLQERGRGTRAVADAPVEPDGASDDKRNR